MQRHCSRNILRLCTAQHEATAKPPAVRSQRLCLRPQDRCRCPRFPHAAFGRVIELGLVPVFTFVPCYPSAAAGTPSPTSTIARLRVHGCSFRATLAERTPPRRRTHRIQANPRTRAPRPRLSGSKNLVALNFPPGDSAIFRRPWLDTRSQNSSRSLSNAGMHLCLRMRLPLKSGSATKIRTIRLIRF